MNTTKEAITTAFIKLYMQKPYEKITIKELCQKAPVARTTFYEYYENLAQLKAEIEDRTIQGILELADQTCDENITNIDLTKYFLNVFTYIKENWSVNEAFLVKQPNYEYIEKWKKALKYHLKCRFPQKVTIPNYDLIAEVIASGVIGAYIYWMKHPEQVEPSKINEISVKALNALMDII